MIVADASGKRLNLTFASADPPDLSDRVNYEENVTRPWSKFSISHGRISG
jgi:hypothetical protein